MEEEEAKRRRIWAPFYACRWYVVGGTKAYENASLLQRHFSCAAFDQLYMDTLSTSEGHMAIYKNERWKVFLYLLQMAFLREIKPFPMSLRQRQTQLGNSRERRSNPYCFSSQRRSLPSRTKQVEGLGRDGLLLAFQGQQYRLLLLSYKRFELLHSVFEAWIVQSVLESVSTAISDSECRIPFIRLTAIAITTKWVKKKNHTLILLWKFSTIVCRRTPKKVISKKGPQPFTLFLGPKEPI